MGRAQLQPLLLQMLEERKGLETSQDLWFLPPFWFAFNC